MSKSRACGKLVVGLELEPNPKYTWNRLSSVFPTGSRVSCINVIPNSVILNGAAISTTAKYFVSTVCVSPSVVVTNSIVIRACTIRPGDPFFLLSLVAMSAFSPRPTPCTIVPL